MTWTEDTETRLKDMWENGASAKECGEALGVSRNAVLGKVARLKLGRRRAPNRDHYRFEKMIDLIAEQDLSIDAAAAEVGLPIETARLYWKRLCAEKGNSAL